jgi:hypothetical protein
MKALGSAIRSGNLSTEQSAFTTVQNDLKSTPSQAVTNAESAVNQTVQWMDDLLNLSSASSAPTAPVDPTTAMLNAAYGLNSSSNLTDGNSTDPNATDPTTSILDSAYGDSAAGSSIGSTQTSGPVASGSDAASPVSSGNAGSGASVNVYA